METKFAPMRWNTSGESLKLHGRARRHWNFIDANRLATCYISDEYLSAQDDACRFVQITPNCRQAVFMFDYLEFMVCRLNIDKSTMVALGLALFTFYTCLLYIVIVHFVVPNLLTLHKLLPTTSYHYGVVVIANLLVLPQLWYQKSLCDLPVEASSLLLSETIVNTLATFTVSIAVVCYKKSYFQTNWHFTGNMLLLMFTNLYVAYLINVQHHNNASPPEEHTSLDLTIHAKAFVVLYISYIFYHIFTSRLFDDDKRERPSSIPVQAVRSSSDEEYYRRAHMSILEVDSIDMDIVRNSVFVPRSSQAQAQTQVQVQVQAQPGPGPVPVPEATEGIVWTAHKQALIPLYYHRSLLIHVKCLLWPLWTIIAITIPVIEDGRHLSGWCKYLVCTGLLCTPVMAKIHNVPPRAFYAILVIVVVLINVTVWYSYAEKPPRFYQVFSLIGIINGLALSHIIGMEIDALVHQMLTYVRDFNTTTGTLIMLCFGECMTECFFCWGLSTPEHGRKAFGTIFGIAVFYSLTGLPTVVLDKCYKVHQQLNITPDTATTYLFLAIVLIFTMLSVVTTDYEIRRSHGGFLMMVFLLYVLFERLIAKDFMHSYGTNHKISVRYNPNNVNWA